MNIRKSITNLFTCAVAALALAAINIPTYAADGTWTLNNNGTWSTPGNWSGGTVADGTDSTAFLSDVINNNRTITLDTARTIGNITAQDTSHNYTITGANTLTFDRTIGTPTLSVGANRTLGLSTPIAGSDGLLLSGGKFSVRSATFSHTGGTTVDAEAVLTGNNLGSGNWRLDNRVLSDYYRSTTVFSGGLGTGANQVQIYGESGFGGGNGNSNWRIGGNNSVLTWGSSDFNPTTLQFQSTFDNHGPGIYGTVTLQNGLDLGSAARTIDVFASGVDKTRTTATINGVIQGTGGSLIKTGEGVLILNGNGSYTGNTAVNEGTLRINSGDSHTTGNDYTVASGATLDVDGTVSVAGTTTIAGTADVAGTLSGDTTVQTGGSLAVDGGTLGASAGTDVITIQNGVTVTADNNSDIRGAVTIKGDGVTGGTLNLVDSLSGFSVGSITVEDGATFRVGGGNIVDTVTVDGLFTIADAGGTGRLVSDTFNMGNGGEYVYSIDASIPYMHDGNWGDGDYQSYAWSDLVTADTLTLGSLFDVEVNVLAGAIDPTQDYVLFEIDNGAATLSGFDANAFNFIAGGATSFGVVPPSVELLTNVGPTGQDLIVFSLTAFTIPEPSTMGLYALGGLLIYLRRRNMFKKMV